MVSLNKKLETLKSLITGYEKMAVAFSGGVDSTFLLKAAYSVLGHNVIAITIKSIVSPPSELDFAIDFVKNEGIRHIVFDFDIMSVPGFSENPANRCYICKKELFQNIKRIALENQIHIVADGSNTNDQSDYRPGLLALQELNILSPLKEAGFTKNDIRKLSKAAGLSTWKKPSLACLATRIPYNEPITKEKLMMISRGEETLRGLGFEQVRVRCHGAVARIEVEETFFENIMKPHIRKKIYDTFRDIGFLYVSLDITGYKMGSMNGQIRNKPETIK